MRRVGEFEVRRVVESEGPLLKPEVFFPQSTPDIFAQHAHWLKPRHLEPASGLLVLCIQSYLVRTGRHTILVDACVGNDKDRAVHRPAWHRQNWPYLEDMCKAGVRPEEIDFVLCTHLHIDHVGWNTRLRNGRWVPTFPNAKYIFARQEYAFWEERHRQDGGAGQGMAFADSVLPVMEARQAVLVDTDHEIAAGVWFEPAPGHTAGNVVVNLRSGSDHAVLTGDVIHHPIQLVRPDWSSRACEDPVQSHRTRRALLERYADSATLFAPAHFASPSIGHVVRAGEHFAYRD